MVDYADFSVVAIEAIKEQQKIIDNQNKKIDNQEQKINDLLERVKKLEIKN